jgi:hypothetical protein
MGGKFKMQEERSGIQNKKEEEFEKEKKKHG